MSTVTKCDICGEVIDGNYKIVTYEWNLPYIYSKADTWYKDRQRGSNDICPECWNKIFDFAVKFKSDPHIRIITEEEYLKL